MKTYFEMIHVSMLPDVSWFRGRIYDKVGERELFYHVSNGNFLVARQGKLFTIYQNIPGGTKFYDVEPVTIWFDEREYNEVRHNAPPGFPPYEIN